MKKNKVINFVFLFAVFLLLFTANNVFGSTVTDAENQYNNIKNQLKQNDRKLQGVEKEINDYNYDIADLDSKITQYSAKLSDIQGQIDTINSKLSEQNQALQEASQKYNSAQDIYATRLRAIYENGLPSVFDVLLSSQGISDFFSKINVVSSMLDYDKNLTSNMESQKKYIDYIKKDIETQKVQLDQLKADASKSKEALDDTITTKQNEVAKLQSDKTNLEEKKKILAQQEADAKSNMLAQIAASQGKQGFDGNFGGTFAWPISSNTPNAYFITSAFADKEYKPKYGREHRGVDIGVKNANVYAMADGKVIISDYNTVYGNRIVIDHGTNYYTFYVHLSLRKVDVGQNVKQGDLIGISGNTGTGAGEAFHLHVELITYINKKFMSNDWMPYFASSGFPFKYWADTKKGIIISYPFSNISKYQDATSLPSFISL